MVSTSKENHPMLETKSLLTLSAIKRKRLERGARNKEVANPTNFEKYISAESSHAPSKSLLTLSAIKKKRRAKENQQPPLSLLSESLSNTKNVTKEYIFPRRLSDHSTALLLEKLDAEVNLKIRAMEQDVNIYCKQIEYRYEMMLNRIPKSIRDMSLYEFCRRYSGELDEYYRQQTNPGRISSLSKDSAHHFEITDNKEGINFTGTPQAFSVSTTVPQVLRRSSRKRNSIVDDQMSNIVENYRSSGFNSRSSTLLTIPMQDGRLVALDPSAASPAMLDFMEEHEKKHMLDKMATMQQHLTDFMSKMYA